MSCFDQINENVYLVPKVERLDCRSVHDARNLSGRSAYACFTNLGKSKVTQVTWAKVRRLRRVIEGLPSLIPKAINNSHLAVDRITVI
jgi:hypothetical protein